MQQQADGTSPNVSEAGGDHTTGPSDLLDDALTLTHELRETLHDQLRLAGCEAQRAAISLAAMAAAAVGIGVLLASAWLGLMTVGGLALIRLGVAPAIAALVAVALNLIVSWVPYQMIRARSRNLRFPATLRTLRPARAPGREREAA